MELILLRPLWLIALIPWLWQGWHRRRQPPLLAPAMQAYLLPASRPQRPWLWLATLPVILALSGPALRGELQQQPAAPLDIWLLDLSRSMTATDLKPDRATRVRWQLQQLLSRAKGERIALILYAGDAYLAMPPTRDHQALSLLLPDLRPDIMPLQGSNPARAVELAMKQLAPGEQARLLLVTDDLTRNQMTQIAALWPCQQRLLCRDTQSARLDILLASSGQPAPMPAIPANELGFATRMPAQLPAPDSQAIAALANRLGGELQWLGNDVPRFAPPPTTTSALTPAPLDLGPWLLIPLLPLALLARVGARLMIALMVGAQLLAPQDLQAAEKGDLQAMQAYQEGDFQRAAHTFNDPVWRGNAWYRAGAYRQAIAAYQEATSATAHYNRGNALLQLGEFAAAKEAYLAALALEPGHEDALYNLSLLQGAAAAAPDTSNSKQPEPSAAQQATAMPLPTSPPVLLLEQRLRKEALRRDLIKVEEPW
ncbi:VWA domain-containing protein [Aeromonas veronii]|uniref:VWA domain-containing protein n=1 Tax=Aeromonas veronii TaxID=654 RepID=UPI001BCA716C|nr:VWA domain-containing protein [Aeromonas veronii]MBS4724511.1 VWA domain-containing protein [Aeromonas veronii]